MVARLLAGYTWIAKDCAACGEKFQTFDRRQTRCDTCVKQKRHAKSTEAVHLWIDEVLAPSTDDKE